MTHDRWWRLADGNSWPWAYSSGELKITEQWNVGQTDKHYVVIHSNLVILYIKIWNHDLQKGWGQLQCQTGIKNAQDSQNHSIYEM